MLLGQSRILEALWALVSLSHFSKAAFKPIIHDDGSLTAGNVELLAQKFPNVRVIGKAEADSVVERHFTERGLERCRRYRRSFILARKVFDPVLFAEADSYVVLDSDVLFFSEPSDLMHRDDESSERSSPSRYSVDNGYRYSLPPEELSLLIGMPTVDALNSGVMRLNKADLDFGQMEDYLAHPGLWRADGRPDYYSEMTLFALELTRARALPLPLSYRIAPGIPLDGEVVAGHYCGGITSAHIYYSRALPLLHTSLIPQ